MPLKILLLVLLIELLVLPIMYMEHRKDCKEYGAENIMSFKERLEAYALCVIAPTILGWCMRKD